MAENIFEHEIVIEFLKKAVWQTFLQAAIITVPRLVSLNGLWA